MVLFMLCSMFIHENKGLVTEPLHMILLSRWQRLCYRAYERLASKFLGSADHALDEAVARYWSDYRPTNEGWSKARWGDCDHPSWITTQSLVGGNGEAG